MAAQMITDITLPTPMATPSIPTKAPSLRERSTFTTCRQLSCISSASIMNVFRICTRGGGSASPTWTAMWLRTSWRESGRGQFYTFFESVLAKKMRTDPDARRRESMKKNPKITQARFTRRQFLRGATLSTAGFMIVPGAVLGLRGATPSSGKLNLAGIGFGGQGAHDLAQMESENIIALCDVDKQHAGHIFTKYSKAKQFTDYRKMLDEMKEIDAVVIATPDHHHALASIEAIKRGKHVYCEKPLTHSDWDARK